MSQVQRQIRAILLMAALAAGAARGAESDPSPELVARRGLAYQLMQSGKPGEAADEAQRSLATHAGDPDLLRILAEASQAAGRKAAAAEAWERYFAKVGRGSLGERVELARLYGQMGRREAMRRTARELSPAAGDSSSDVLNYYGLMLELDDAAGAERARRFLDAASLAGDEAQELRADQLVLEGRHLEAAAIFGRLYRKHPDRRDLGWQEVHALANAGHRRAAFARAVHLAPGEGPSEDLLFTGELALDLDEIAWAERIAARIPEGHSPAAALLHAKLLRLGGRELTALATVERARARAPRHEELAALAAELLVDQGRAAEALALIPSADRSRVLEMKIAAVRVLRALGRESEASAASGRLLDGRVTAAESLDALEFLIEQEDWARAEAALARVPARGGDADRRELARCAIAHGRGAAPAGASVAGLLPGLPQEAQLDALELLVRMGEVHTALAHLRGFPAKTPTRQLRAALLAYRAELDATGSRAACLAHVERAVAARHPEQRVPTELAIAMADLGRYGAAAAAVAEAPGHDRVEGRLLAARVDLYDPARRGGAAARLVEIAGENPPGDTVRLDLVEALSEVGHEERASAFLDPAAPVAPAEAVRRTALAARVLAARGQRAEASRLLSRETARAGEHMLLLAEARLNLPDPTGAAAQIAALPRALGDGLRARLALAECRMLEGRGAEARALVTDLSRASIDADTPALALAELELLTGSYAAAARRHAAIGRETRASYRGRLLAAQLELADDAPERVPETAKELGAGHVDVLVASLGARGLVALHRPLPAKALLESALARFPGHPGLCDDLADAYLEMNLPAEALAVIDRCIASLTDAGIEPIALLEQARVRTLLRLARTAEAEEILVRLEARDREGADVLRERASVAARKGDFAGALALQRRALALQERPPVVEEIAVGAYLLEAEGRGAARAYLEELGRRRPGKVDAEAALGELLATGNHTRDEAIPALQGVVARSPEHPARAPLAAVLLNQAHLDAAEHELATFRQHRPFDVAGDLVGANVHIARQELEDAHRILSARRAERPYDEDVFVGSTSLARTLGDGYRHEARTFASTARTLAPRASAVERVARPLFEPGLVAEASSEAGSDTLERRLLFEEYTFPLGDRATGRVGSRYRDVHRAGASVDFIDVAAGLTYNPWTGGAFRLDALAGTGGVLGTEVLPTLDYTHTFRSGSNVGVAVGRRRIEESPEALALDLTSEAFSAHGELVWDRVLARVTATSEEISDGNERRQVTALARVRATQRVYAVVEHEERRSRFEPVPFFLYFGPRTYRSTALGFDLDPLLVVDQFRVSLLPRFVTDSLDGARARGGSATLTVAYNTPSGGRLALDVEHAFLGATRRLDLDDAPFHQNNAALSYRTTF